MLPLTLLIGLTFAAMGLVITSVSPSYDFFMYYFSLLITPMVLLSGVFFPVTQLPEALQAVSAVLPLRHAIELARPLIIGAWPAEVALHLSVLAAYAVTGFCLALVLSRRRLLK